MTDDTTPSDRPPSPEEYPLWVALGGPALVEADLTIVTAPVRRLLAQADRGMLTAGDFIRALARLVQDEEVDQP